MKYGLEKEFFLCTTPGNEIVIPQIILPTLPIDGCGYLIEARGLPYDNIYEAVYSLNAEIHRIEDLLPSNVMLLDSPVEKLSKEFLFKISRKYVKGLTKYQNIYGYSNHRIKNNERTAGVHISFTDTKSYYGKDNQKFTYNQNFDWLSIFKALDSYFSDEIKDAKRNKGFYELKEDGRIEYRSLPADIDLNKVIRAINLINN
jgi:hypothetical protein